jgi:tetratricopeptide (TPR) repeat protein
MLGTLVEQAGPDTLVLLVSERGVQTGGLRPQDPDTAFRQFGGAPWYREHGIVALAGPGVKAGARVTGAGLLDIAPTVLRCLDMPIGEDMPGRVLLEAFESMPDERSVVSHELQREQGSATARQRLPEAHREAALKRWQETGLLDPRLLEESEPGIEARRQRDFNQAMVALEARRFNRARELLEILHQELHDDDRVALHLARVRRQAGDLDGARALLEGVVDHPDHRPYEQMQLAQIHQLAGDHDRALMHLFRAEQTQGDRPGVHCQIGRVYLAMQRWDDAERAFGKALERDDQHIDSQCGMAETRLGQQRYREAVDAALRAIDLDSTRQQAHYLLGAALLGDGQAEIAAEVFETCLKLNPGHADAHKKLAEACEVLGDTSAAGQHRDIAQKLESAARLQQQLSDYRWKPR